MAPPMYMGLKLSTYKYGNTTKCRSAEQLVMMVVQKPTIVTIREKY